MIRNNNIRKTDLTIDLLFQRLRDLLGSQEPVTISKVPEVLQDDFFHFIIGKTVNMDEAGNILIHKIDFKNWMDKLRDRGFDYAFKVKI